MASLVVAIKSFISSLGIWGLLVGIAVVYAITDMLLDYFGIGGIEDDS